MAGKKRKREQLTIRVDPDLYDFFHERQGAGHQFHNWTHVVESALAHYREHLIQREALLPDDDE